MGAGGRSDPIRTRTQAASQKQAQRKMKCACRAVKPREGEAPAEPDVSAQCSVLSAQCSVFSNRQVPRWAVKAAAEPQESGAWHGFGSAGASPSQRVDIPWQGNLWLSTGFCVDPKSNRFGSYEQAASDWHAAPRRCLFKPATPGILPGLKPTLPCWPYLALFLLGTALPRPAWGSAESPVGGGGSGGEYFNCRVGLGTQCRSSSALRSILWIRCGSGIRRGGCRCRWLQTQQKLVRFAIPRTLLQRQQHAAPRFHRITVL